MTYLSPNHSVARQRGLAIQTLLLIIAGVVIVLAVGAAAYFYFAAGHDKAGPTPAEKAPPPAPIFVKIDPMTVNLQGSGQVLYIGLSLDVKSQADADKLTSHMPQVRNRMLIALSDESADKLTTSDGKREVAKTLKDTLSKPYDDTAPVDIKNVLYTNFIVQ